MWQYVQTIIAIVLMDNCKVEQFCGILKFFEWRDAVAIRCTKWGKNGEDRDLHSSGLSLLYTRGKIIICQKYKI